MNSSNTAIICLSPHIGGMELDALKLSVILDKYIHITTIIKENTLLQERCQTNQDFKNLNVETINFKVNLLSPSIIINMRRLIKKNNIKNIIFFGASELKSLYFAFLGMKINLIVRHGTIKGTSKKDWFHKLIYSNVNHHVSISKYLQENVRKIIPFGQNSIENLIIPSMYKEISSITHQKNEILSLVHIGRVVPGKGIDKAIIALSILKENKIPFLFHSYGPRNEKYEPILHSLVDTLNYKDNLIFHSFTNNVFDLYKQNDIFIFPTDGEGYGNVMMEAISHGIICLSYNNSAIIEFKEMGFHIHLVQDASQEALNQQLLYISNNLEKEKTLAQLNIQQAKSIFSMQREAKNYLEILI